MKVTIEIIQIQHGLFRIKNYQDPNAILLNPINIKEIEEEVSNLQGQKVNGTTEKILGMKVIPSDFVRVGFIHILRLEQ